MSHRSGSSRTRSQSVCVLFGIALFVLLPATGSASPADSLGREGQTAIDSDGDGIADEFDPDDDNDGTADDQEGSAGNPGPDILDPGKDSDTDGIPNVLDPDDNNNAVADEDDPTSVPPSGGGSSSSPPSQGPAPDSPRPPTVSNTSISTHTDINTNTSTITNSNDVGEGPLVIQALPVTGSGPQVSANVLIPALSAIAVLLGSGGGWLVMVRRTTNQRTPSGVSSPMCPSECSVTL